MAAIQPGVRNLTMTDSAEANAFLAHPVPGLRLRGHLAAVPALDGRDGVFGQALEKYFDGAPDPMTLKLLTSSP